MKRPARSCLLYTSITITETDNKGVVDIFGLDKEAMDAALSRIKSIVAQPEVGDVDVYKRQPIARSCRRSRVSAICR